jgi:hypothetical protein
MASSLKARLVLATTGVAALLGLGAGVAGVLPDLQADKTSIDDVRIAESTPPSAPAAPAPSSTAGAALAGGTGTSTVSLASAIELDHPPVSYTDIDTVWVVPVSAPLGEFPLAKNAAADRSCLNADAATISDCLKEKAECTDPQLKWLEEHAYRTNSRLQTDGVFLDYVQIRNAATDGAALSIKEILPKGEYRTIPGESFTLTCMAYFSAPIGGAAGSAQIRPATVDLGGEAPAIFGEPLGYGDDSTIDIPAGAPAVLNLAPGQSATLGITSTSTAPYYFNGWLEATVSSGSQSDVLPLIIKGSQNFSVAFPSNTTARLQLHGGSMCPEPAQMYPGAFKYKDLTVCTIADFLEAEGLD